MFCEGIDWAATGSMLSGIGAIVTPILAIIAALYGYTDWKKRERYKSNRSIAIEALSVFDEMREALDGIRSPFSPGHEQAEAKQALAEAGINENDQRFHARTQQYVVQKRIQDRNEQWEKVAAIAPKLYAHFGSDTKVHMRELLKARQEVWVAAEMYGSSTSDKTLERAHAAIWKGYGAATEKGVDEIDKKLDEAQRAMEEKLRIYVEWDRK